MPSSMLGKQVQGETKKHAAFDSAATIPRSIRSSPSHQILRITSLIIALHRLHPKRILPHTPPTSLSLNTLTDLSYDLSSTSSWRRLRPELTMAEPPTILLDHRRPPYSKSFVSLA
jgi:hypothetical protein